MEKQTILTRVRASGSTESPEMRHTAARFLAECIWLNTGALEGRMGDGAEKAAVTGQNGRHWGVGVGMGG